MRPWEGQIILYECGHERVTKHASKLVLGIDTYLRGYSHRWCPKCRQKLKQGLADAGKERCK